MKLTARAANDLEALPVVIHVRVLKLMERLVQWPNVSGAKPLRAELAGSDRMRTGDYRLQCHVSGGTVVIDRIGHRDGFYDE